MTAKTALIIGAHSILGKALIKLLLKKHHYQKIIVLTRKKIDFEDDRLEVVLLRSFDDLESVSDRINAHDYYLAMSTTTKKAGSKEALLKEEVEYPLKMALLAMAQPDFQQLLVLSAVSASPFSPTFYNRAKGRLEQGLHKLNLHSLKIFRPSMIIADTSELKFTDHLSKFFSAMLSFFVIGRDRKLWTVHADVLARAMYRVAKKGAVGVKRYYPKKIIKIAQV